MMLLYNNKKQHRQKTVNKNSLKDCMEYFFNFLYKNITHDKILLSDVALSFPKNTARADMLNEV